MSYAKDFRNAAKSFNGAPFTKEQLCQKLIEISDNHLFEQYFKNHIKRSYRGFRIIDLGNGLYNISIDESVNNTQSVSTSKKKPKLERIHVCHEINQSDDDSLRIFIYTLITFERLSNNARVTNYMNYFKESDVNALHPTNPRTNPMEFIYKQLAFHAQNGTQIEKVIKWKDNEPYIREITDNYNRNSSLRHSKQDFIAHFGSTQIDVLDSYYECLNDIGVFLSTHPTPQSVKDAFEDQNPREIFNKMHSAIGHRYGRALTFDFLKEFGRVFGFSCFDYPKPDLHVKRNIAFIRYDNMGDIGFLSSYKTTSFDTEAIDPFDTIQYYVELMEKAKRSYVNHGGTHANKFTNYLFDKMIFIVCSGKFYLNNITIGNKEGVNYTKGLGNKEYLSININNEMPQLESFLDRV